MSVKVGSEYDENMRLVLDTVLKRKGRLHFYPCVADALLDALDHTCHKRK